MSNIDEISRTLGAIQADIANIKEQLPSMSKKMDMITFSNIEQSQKIENTIRKLEEIEPIIEDYTRNRQRAFGALAVITGLAGLGGAFLNKIAGIFIN
jgi:chromosome segregation ATPase